MRELVKFWHPHNGGWYHGHMVEKGHKWAVILPIPERTRIFQGHPIPVRFRIHVDEVVSVQSTKSVVVSEIQIQEEPKIDMATKKPTNGRKSEKARKAIILRFSTNANEARSQKKIVEDAAKKQGKTITSFLLDTILSAAQKVTGRKLTLTADKAEA